MKLLLRFTQGLPLQYGVHQLRVQPLMIIGRASQNIKTLIPSHEQYVKLLRKIYQYKNSPNQSIFLEWGDPLDHIFRFKNTNRSYTISMNIKANGDIAVSPYLPITVGNIRTHSIKSYWESGYPQVWKLHDVQKMAEELYSVEKMYSAGNVSHSWFDADIHFDLIDNHVNFMSEKI